MPIDPFYDYPKKGGSDAAVCEALEKDFEWGLQARKPFERKAMQSLYFWAGDQWLTVESDLQNRFSRKITRPPLCESSRIVDNQIPIYVRSLAATSTDALSSYEALPATAEEVDKQAAILATRFLRLREREDNESKKRQEELLWMFGTGEVLRRTWFNSKKVTKDGQKGDVDTEVVPFLKYVKCPDSADEWPPRWLIEFDVRHVDWVKETYGKTVDPEDVADRMAEMDSLAMNVTVGKAPVRSEKSSSVILKRMYASPSAKYPHGHCWVWANKVLLKEHDFQSDEFPFARSYWYPIPGRLYAMSYIEPLTSDQKQLNTLLSQFQEIRNRQLRNDILTQGAGDVTQRILDSKTGQKEVRLDPGIARWEFMRYDVNVQNADQEYSRIMRNLHDKAGQAEPNLGQVTSRETTATELQLLKEAGMQSIAFHMRNFDVYQCDVSRQKLVMARDFFKSARIVSDLAAGETTYFFGADFRDTRDVVSVPVPRMTPAMRRQAISEAVNQGLMGPWIDPKTGMPSIFVQYASRQKLRSMGLVEEDDQLSVDFGSFEELRKKTAILQKAGEEMALIEAMKQIQMSQMQPQQPQGMNGGQNGGLMPTEPAGPGGAAQPNMSPVGPVPAGRGFSGAMPEAYLDMQKGETRTDAVLQQ